MINFKIASHHQKKLFVRFSGLNLLNSILSIMELYVYLIAFALVMVFALALPMLSGIGTFKITRPTTEYRGSKKDSTGKGTFKFQLKKEFVEDGDNSVGVSTSSSKKGKLEVDSKTGLKRRVIGVYDEDPNNFDYDIDDLANEDKVEEEQEQAKRLQQFQGNTGKAYEELV